ncbi:MAG: hypothetical protein JXB26_10650 [Candidatus Aminicenantes bacterium]|nr:hypothetical protein [Candidatus Aminicenantes bacterium]
MRIVDGKIYIKIIFFGTALAGKTTSLQWLFQHLIPADMKITDQIRSVKTSFGQTLLFDFVPVQLHQNIIVRFYAATGQDYYTSTRKLIFNNVDGVFFVIDSQKKEMEHNKEFVDEFKKYLQTIKELQEAKVIVLYNKQDLDEVYNPEDLEKELRLTQYDSWPTCALTGMNLRASFQVMICDLLKKLKEKGDI